MALPVRRRFALTHPTRPTTLNGWESERRNSVHDRLFSFSPTHQLRVVGLLRVTSSDLCVIPSAPLRRTGHSDKALQVLSKCPRLQHVFRRREVDGHVV